MVHPLDPRCCPVRQAFSTVCGVGPARGLAAACAMEEGAGAELSRWVGTIEPRERPCVKGQFARPGSLGPRLPPPPAKPAAATVRVLRGRLGRVWAWVFCTTGGRPSATAAASLRCQRRTIACAKKKSRRSAAGHSAAFLGAVARGEAICAHLHLVLLHRIADGRHDRVPLPHLHPQHLVVVLVRPLRRHVHLIVPCASEQATSDR